MLSLVPCSLPLVLCITEGERRVAEDQNKIDSLKEDVRDKTARVNELEVYNVDFDHCYLMYMHLANYNVGIILSIAAD